MQVGVIAYVKDVTESVRRVLGVAERVLSRTARRAAAAFDLDVALLDFVPTAELGLAAPRPLRAGLRTDKLRRQLGHGLPSSYDALRAMRRDEPAG